MKILENAVPFATGSCRKFKPDDSALYLMTETYPSAVTNIVGPSSGIVLSVWTCLFDVLKEPIIWASGSTERVQKKFSGPLASL